MKILAKLERNKTFWYILGLSFIFFLLRLPSLIEPNWYGDEGIYQVLGIAINKGRLLYVQIWDNKPPLLYIVYSLFHGDQFQVRLFSLISGVLAIWSFFYLTLLLFKQLKASIISTLFFVLLFATPILEGNIANAENFMLPLTTTAGLLVYSLSSKRQFLILNSKFLILPAAGFLLGIAFLFKIVAVFDLAAFCIFIIIINAPDKLPSNFSKLKSFLKNEIKPIHPIFLGFIFPIIITFLYFLFNHAFSDFTTAVFFSNVGYVGYGNKLIIPQGLLILKLALLSTAVLIIFWRRKQLNKAFMFVLLWLVFSLFNTFFSGRPYTHYTLVTVPSLCLLVGLLSATNKKRDKSIYLLTLVCTIILLSSVFKPNLNKSLRYYENALSFLMNKKDVISYQSFFDQKTPRDYEIASFIKTHTSSADNVFLWGDTAQIYALSEKLPPGKYAVSYHIGQYKGGLEQTQTALNLAKPKYVITLPESRPFPFHLSMYSTKFVFKDVVFYERNY